MFKAKNLVFVVAAITVFSFMLSPMIVRADWDPAQPAKYVQLPNLTSTGMDVNATWLFDVTQPPTAPPQPIYPFQKILADDFPCYQTGPITDIHLWGSWLGDRKNDNTSFKLSIHTDVPATPNTPSHPGDLKWSWIFKPSEYVVRPYATAQELFYEPNTNAIIGRDTQVWQYNFFIDPATAFIQQGTTS